MMRRCDQRTEWGRCAQEGTVALDGFARKVLCAFHAHWFPLVDDPDPGYHRKVVLGLLEPAACYLSDEELRATLHGRSRGDGRRLDSYCLDDQIDRALEV